MKYREFKSLDLTAIDKEVSAFWEQENVFEKSISSRDANNPFVFFEGPPSANGMPGIHHVMSRTIKDLFCRYKTMKGFRVERKGGWDTHGLPVELSVEQLLGIRKDEIGTKISVAEYNATCRREVMKYKEAWEDLTRKMGYWVDLKNPYVTFENKYIETLWWLIKELYKKGFLYKGYTIQPYSPAAGTGLSSHELNQPGTYRDVKDTTVVAQFKIKRDSTNIDFGNWGDAFFLAWTTTPWTLPSNTALAVGEKIKYAVVQTYNPYTNLPITVVLANDAVARYFKPENASLDLASYNSGDKEIPYKIIGEYSGKDFDGVRFEQLMPYVQPTNGDAFKVIIGDFVTTEDGTGIVHIAPSFGSDDMRMARKYGLGTLTLVDKRGRFVNEVTDYPGVAVKDFFDEPGYESTDVQIAIKLKKENKAFRVEKYEHSYPHCWRTDKPVIYYPLDSWFIKSTAVKDRIVELNKTINWKPTSTGTGRFGQWLENLVDWNLSRSRYWGTPLPIWRTEDGSEEKCIGSVEELQSEIKKAIAAGVMSASAEIKNQDSEIELHKPYVDNVTLVSDSGKPMYRESDLIDVWFDSGAMPYAQWHYPFENKEIFEKNFPADFIAEGVDQTRGWFFTLHVIAVMLYDSVAYKNVVSNGLVLDKNGVKMSKRLGNLVNPFTTIEQYGADATRWYIISNSQPWDNLKFDMGGIDEVRRKFFGTLYNTYSFFSLYSNIDGLEIDETKKVAVSQRTELDRWVISKLHSLVKEVTEYYEDYEPTKAARAIEKFVDEHLSNWYVRLSRRRFWKGEMNADKQAAYETLFECLKTTAQLIAPIAPFFSDWLYRNLKGDSQSVHVSIMATADQKVIDLDLERRMQLAQDFSSMVLSLRKKVKINVRQPLSRVMIPVLNDQFQNDLKQIEGLITAEVNVKAIEYVNDTNGVFTKKVKADFKKLGAKLGKNMKAVADLISKMTQEEIQTLEKNKVISFMVNDGAVEIGLDEVEVLTEDIPGWFVANMNDLTVALDVTMTDELKEEGNARELVNRIQRLRKDKDFNVTDRIVLRIEKHPELEASLVRFKDYICTEILAGELSVVDSLTEGDMVEINDTPVKVNITLKN